MWPNRFDRTDDISALSRSLDRVEILISCSVHKCECQCGTPMLTSYSIESTSIRFQLLRGEVFKLCRISTKITATHNILPIFVIRELNFSIIVRCKTMQPPSPLFFFKAASSKNIILFVSNHQKSFTDQDFSSDSKYLKIN